MSIIVHMMHHFCLAKIENAVIELLGNEELKRIQKKQKMLVDVEN